MQLTLNILSANSADNKFRKLDLTLHTSCHQNVGWLMGKFSRGQIDMFLIFPEIGSNLARSGNILSWRLTVKYFLWCTNTG